MGTLSFPIASSKPRLLSITNPIAFPNCFLQTSSPSSAIRLRNFSILYLRRSVLCSAAETGRSNHDDHHHVHDHHHHHHHHGHHHCDHDVELFGPQKAVIGLAKAIRWTDLASYLKEHLQLCCCSMALFVAAVVCPYLVPNPIVKPLQNALIVIAYSLVGSGIEGEKLLKASLGSLDFITSCYKSESKSKEIKEVVNTSSYKSEFVHDALAVDGKPSMLHEGGTLLVCLNSIRALNNPSWSWRQELKQLLMELKFKGSQPSLKTSSTTVQSSPV